MNELDDRRFLAIDRSVERSYLARENQYVGIIVDGERSFMNDVFCLAEVVLLSEVSDSVPDRAVVTHRTFLFKEHFVGHMLLEVLNLREACRKLDCKMRVNGRERGISDEFRTTCICKMEHSCS